MNKSKSSIISVDVSTYDQSVEAFDAFIESIQNDGSPLSAILDQLESDADAHWDGFECAKPLTLLEISRQASSGLPSGAPA